jgi:hypothetical protein
MSASDFSFFFLFGLVRYNRYKAVFFYFFLLLRLLLLLQITTKPSEKNKEARERKKKKEREILERDKKKFGRSGSKYLGEKEVRTM